MTTKLSLDRARAFWQKRQGLGDPVKGSIDEVDQQKEKIVWATFDAVTAKEKKEIEAQAEEVAAFLGAIGHAKAFSLDTTESIEDRAKLVRAMR